MQGPSLNIVKFCRQLQCLAHNWCAPSAIKIVVPPNWCLSLQLKDRQYNMDMCMFLTDFKLSNSLITILKAEACYICFLIIAISSLLWLAGDRKGSSHFPSKYNCAAASIQIKTGRCDAILNSVSRVWGGWLLLLIKSGVVIMNHASANWNRELRAPAARPPLLARTSVLVLFNCV